MRIDSVGYNEYRASWQSSEEGLCDEKQSGFLYCWRSCSRFQRALRLVRTSPPLHKRRRCRKKNWERLAAIVLWSLHLPGIITLGIAITMRGRAKPHIECWFLKKLE